MIQPQKAYSGAIWTLKSPVISHFLKCGCGCVWKMAFRGQTV